MKTLVTVSLLFLGGLLARVGWAQTLSTEYPATSAEVPHLAVPDGGADGDVGDVAYNPDYQSGAPDPQSDAEVDVDIDYDYEAQAEQQAVATYDDGYDPQAYTQFESSLAPYGNWVDDNAYGRVWVPSAANVGYDFAPYATGGHWVLSEYGWTWVSDWDWGWGPFHYGRWVSLAGWGWSWVPGTHWGPAWVCWRSGGGYVGWAPLPPSGVRISPPRGVRSPWRFAVASHLGSRGVAYLPARAVSSILPHTAVVLSTRAVGVGGVSVRYNAGPTNLLSGGGVGLSSPVRLATVAPTVLPRPAIAARPSAPLSTRPWVRAGVTLQTPHAAPPVRSIQLSPGIDPAYRQPILLRPAPARIPSSGLAPRYAPPSYSAPTQRAATTTWAAPSPVYRAPAPTYQAPPPMPSYQAPPVYRPPAVMHTQPSPVYQAPAPIYRPPAVMHTQPSYSAPVYRAPVYSAPAVQAPPVYHAPPAVQTYHSAPAPAPVYRAPVGGGRGATASPGFRVR